MRQMKFLFYISLLVILTMSVYAQNLSLVGSYTAPGGAQTISIQGDYAYIGGTGYIDIVNISDPTHPTHSGRVNRSDICRIRAIGNYAYISNGNLWPDGFDIYDISNPSSPSLVSMYPIHYGMGFFLYSNYVYISENWEYYYIIDISDPVNPHLAGNFEGIACGDGCIADDSLAFMGDWDGLRVWNLSDPIHPLEIGFLGYMALHAVIVEENNAYAIEYGGSLYIIDVSNPTSPTMISQYTALADLQSEIISGNFLFLAEGNYGIEVVDISNTFNPTLATSYDTPGFTYESAIVGDYLYVADNTSLQILRFDPTSVDDGNKGVPSKFSLSQNYPNPFNATTQFSYSLPQDSGIQLAIYDLLGQEVAAIFDGPQSAGLHRLTWDATGFPSGVYFARLEAEGQSQSIKLLILK